MNTKCLLVVVGLGCSTLALALVPFSTGPVVAREHVVRVGLGPDSFNAFSTAGDRLLYRLDVRSSHPRVISGGAFALPRVQQRGTSVGPFEQAARRFVDDHRETFGLASTELVLVSGAAFVGSDDQLVKFQRVRDGLVVEDAFIDFRFKHGRLLQVANYAFDEAAPDRSVSGVLDLSGSLRVLPAVRNIQLGDEKYRVIPVEHGYQLVRVREYSLSIANEPYVAQVETGSGKLFELKPVRLYAAGEARGLVYPRKFKDTPEWHSLPYLSLSQSGSPAAVLSDVSGTFDSPDTQVPALRGFQGPYSLIVNKSGDALVRDASLVDGRWVFDVTPTPGAPVMDDRELAQTMAFVNLRRVTDEALKHIDVPWLRGVVTVNVNQPVTCNSYWDGKAVNLYIGGKGCVNTALVADVLFHEWGHGLDYNTGGVTDTAYSEGFGDTISLIMTHSPIIVPDFKEDGTIVRDLRTFKVYPDDMGEAHTEGLIVGGTFWDLYQNLLADMDETAAIELTARYAFRSNLTVNRYGELYDAILAIDDDDGDLTNWTPHYCAINKAFARHGLASLSDRCQLAVFSELRIDDTLPGIGNGNGVAEPGELVRLDISMGNAAEMELASLDAELTIAPKVPGVEITQSSASWPSIVSGSVASPVKMAELSVGADVPCGTEFVIQAVFKSGQRTMTITIPAAVGRFVGTPEVFTIQDLPQAIPDNGELKLPVVTSSAQWVAAPKVQSGHLKIDIKHAYIGDVAIELIPPGQTSVPIYRGAGGFKEIHYDKDITAKIKKANGLGEWNLVVKDVQQSDVGTLEGAVLTLVPAYYECH